MRRSHWLSLGTVIFSARHQLIPGGSEGIPGGDTIDFPGRAMPRLILFGTMLKYLESEMGNTSRRYQGRGRYKRKRARFQLVPKQ